MTQITVIDRADLDNARNQLVALLVEKPLYSFIDMNQPAVNKALASLLGYDVIAVFDHFCPQCKKESTFEIKQGSIEVRPSIKDRYSLRGFSPSIYAFTAVCSRQAHYLSFVLFMSQEKVTKIGQTPSMASLYQGELKSIDGSLDKVDREELGRALGLFAHDTALGAFVYLRRVFERMIARANDRHVAAHGEIAGYKDLRVGERIKALADQLPASVVAKSGVFGLLSKGIHELSEEDARDLFPLLKSIIFEMLGEETRLKEAAKQAAETDAAYKAVMQRMGSGGKDQNIEG